MDANLPQSTFVSWLSNKLSATSEEFSVARKHKISRDRKRQASGDGIWLLCQNQARLATGNSNVQWYPLSDRYAGGVPFFKKIPASGVTNECHGLCRDCCFMENHVMCVSRGFEVTYGYWDTASRAAILTWDLALCKLGWRTCESPTINEHWLLIWTYKF